EFIAKDYSQFCSADIEHYLKQLITKNNLTKKAYVNCKTLLINALKYGRRHRLIEYDYNALFKELNGLNRLCSKKGKEPEEQVFNDEEMIKLMQLITAFDIEHFIKMSIKTENLTAKGFKSHLLRSKTRYFSGLFVSLLSYCFLLQLSKD
ncbi:MAG: hypothetical protein K6F44_08135, partial [Lachnospiraceae bacterium]|nr:hypothetical protein [Lachnospiraceae bacterium]